MKRGGYHTIRAVERQGMAKVIAGCAVRRGLLRVLRFVGPTVVGLYENKEHTLIWIWSCRRAYCASNHRTTVRGNRGTEQKLGCKSGWLYFRGLRHRHPT